MDTISHPRPRWSAADIVRAFDGPTKLSALLGGISAQGVWNWTQRGVIPGDWHLRLLRLAEQEGVDLTPDDLLSVPSSSDAA